MGFLGLSKKKKVLDLSEKYKKQQENTAQMCEEIKEAKSQQKDSFGFLSNLASISNSKTQSSDTDVSEDAEDKRRKLAKRLADMTNRLEDLSNQMYHLQQRVELLEKKSNINPY